MDRKVKQKVTALKELKSHLRYDIHINETEMAYVSYLMGDLDH